MWIFASYVSITLQSLSAMIYWCVRKLKKMGMLSSLLFTVLQIGYKCGQCISGIRYGWHALKKSKCFWACVYFTWNEIYICHIFDLHEKIILNDGDHLPCRMSEFLLAILRYPGFVYDFSWSIGLAHRPYHWR